MADGPADLSTLSAHLRDLALEVANEQSAPSSPSTSSSTPASHSKYKDTFTRALFDFVALGRDESLEWLLSGSPADPRAPRFWIDLNDTDACGNPSLVAAAAFGHCNCARTLVEAGASLAAADSLGWTALHWAARNSDVVTASFLVNQGASTHLRTKRGFLPSDLCDLQCSDGWAIAMVLESAASRDPWNDAMRENRFQLSQEYYKWVSENIDASCALFNLHADLFGPSFLQSKHFYARDTAAFHWDMVNPDEMLVFHARDIPRLLDFLFDMHTISCADASSRLRIAATLHLCSRFCRNNLPDLSLLANTALTKFQESISASSSIAQSLFLLSNALAWLYFIHKDAAFRSDFLEKALTVVIKKASESVTEFIKNALGPRQPTRDAPSFLEKIMPRVFARPDPSSPFEFTGPVVNVLSCSVFLLNQFHIPPFITVQIVCETFSWMFAQLFLQMQQHSELLQTPVALSVLSSLKTLSDWVDSYGLPCNIVVTYARPLRQLCEWLRYIPRLAGTSTGSKERPDVSLLSDKVLFTVAKNFSYGPNEMRLSEMAALEFLEQRPPRMDFDEYLKLYHDTRHMDANYYIPLRPLDAADEAPLPLKLPEVPQPTFLPEPPFLPKHVRSLYDASALRKSSPPECTPLLSSTFLSELDAVLS